MTCRWINRLALASALLLPFATPSLAAQLPVAGGPRELVITYRAQPADRPAFRAYLQGEQIAALRKLKAQGVLKSCEILFNDFVQPSTFDAMLVMSFNRFEDTGRWLEIEKTMPGGLSAAGLKLAKPSGSFSADLEWDGAAAQPGAAGEHVFYVIPYTYKVADQYRSYVNGYVIPQTDGWIKEGALSRYRIFMNRYPVGDPDPWDTLFIYEYRSLADFGRREEVLNKVRGPLREVAAWKQLSDVKADIRSESENTIMNFLAAC